MIGWWSSIRFVVVGVLGTIMYFVVTLVLANPAIGAPMAVASLIGFGLSLFVSYIGHAKYTFRVSESLHARYATRYLITSIGLAVLCSALAQALVDRLGILPTYTAGLISLIYPGASFLMHTFWSFAEPSDQTHGRHR